MTDFYRLTIHEVHEKLRAREVSSQELVQSLYKRIEEVDPKIRAYLTLTKDLAFAQAKAADTQFEGRRSTHPLTGIPLAIKDNICVKGVRTTCASKFLADFVSLYDATVIGGLGAAGYVLLGKSNMDEFAMGSSTENSALALTRNPWNLEHIPGGSSGGSAAAVAADECIAALGSGSDYTPFLQHAGIASLHLGFGGEDDGGSVRQVRARRDGEVGGRASQVAQLDLVPARVLGELGVVGQELVHACLDVEPLRDRVLQDVAPLLGEAASRGRDADERGRRPEAERVRDPADDGDALVRLARVLRVEDGDDRIGAVADDATGRLPVVRIGRVAFS